MSVWAVLILAALVVLLAWGWDGRSRNLRRRAGLLYGPQHHGLPRGDNTPHTTSAPKESSAPWQPPRDRGPLMLRPHVGEGGKAR